jgi:phosphomannomutase/phosphoglucomutase
MAELIRNSGKKLSELVADLPAYYSSPEERRPCPDDKKFQVVEKLKKEFSAYKQIALDGVRIEFDGGWALVRASNTEPVLSLRFEANTEQEKDRIRETVLAALRKYGVS